MVMDCPTIAGSALERRAPQPIADDRAAIVVWRRGAGEERAAARGVTPSVAKKFGLTSSARTCSGSPRPVSCASIEA